MNGLDLNKLDSKIFRKRRHSLNFLKNIGKIKINKINFKETIKKYSYGLDKSKKIIDDELDLQKIILYEKLKMKQTYKKIRKQSLRPTVNDIIENFIKKLHLTYVAKVYPKPMELTLDSVLENYVERIQITSHYNDKITQFEMLKMIEECNV
jgi:hypothetical protein